LVGWFAAYVMDADFKEELDEWSDYARITGYNYGRNIRGLFQGSIQLQKIDQKS